MRRHMDRAKLLPIGGTVGAADWSVETTCTVLDTDT